MPEYRTSARLKNRKTTAAPAIQDSSSRNPPKRHKTVASPTSTVEEKPPERKIRGTRGKLKLITEMPFDILYETFSHLHPVDLLHLSQASKSLHDILLNRRAQSVWKTSFVNIQAGENPPPNMPPDMTYPNYALLLFGTVCQICCKVPGIYVHWAARLRFCLACMDFKRPSPAQTRSLERSGHYALFGLSGCPKENIVVSMSRKTFIQTQVKLSRERTEHAQQCFFWVQGQKMKRKMDLQTLRSQRQKAICKRLRAEGWGPELDFLGPRRIPNLPGANKPQALTDRIWSHIRPEVIDFLQEIRVICSQKERKELIQSRMIILYPKYDDYLNTQPRRFPLPGFADICGEAPFRSLIFSTPADNDFTLSDSDRLKDYFAEACKTWFESRSHALEALLPSECPRLDTAAAFFRCQWCKEPISYPRILKHKCLIISQANFKPSGDNVELYDLAVASERPWNFGGDQVEFDEEAAECARDIIAVCGADPREVSAEVMNELDRRVECLRCSQAKGRPAMRWTTAIIHELEKHYEEECQGPRWKLLEDPSEIDFVKNKEQATMNSWCKWVGCNHCGRTLNSGTMFWHLRTLHNIKNITKAEAQHHTFVPLDLSMKHPPYAVKLPRRQLGVNQR
ncbi:hypothetical protein E4T56_gene10745 [Termitomyces sp. T112]|nr:hypothetical protein E4T56_gene10745 [Termitomyces sp. T112]